MWEAAPFDKCHQQLEFGRGEVESHVIDINRHRGLVNFHGANRHQVGIGAGRAACAAKNRGHAQDEFLGAERLGEIVVCPQTESADAIGFFAARRAPTIASVPLRKLSGRIRQRAGQIVLP